MEIFKTIDEMRAWSIAKKGEGKKIAFVPTMGALHEGHLSLIEKAKELADLTVLSIYLNPTQFGPGEDLSSYPKTLEDDLNHAKKLLVDAVFLPSNETMYPSGYETYVSVEEVTKHLCGASRPEHFRGVTTIVAKLFNIVMPDLAVFGEKDFQQLVVIKKMVDDLDIPVKIVGAPIVREPDGIAMSSRNAYLTDEERLAARSINQSLSEAQDMIDSGKTRIKDVIHSIKEKINSEKILKIDYLKIVDPKTLEDLTKFRKPELIAIAVFAGKTRLIDNRLIK